MRVTFIGATSCIPDIGSETACFAIDGRHLVDTGWNAVLNMRKYGLDPLGLRSVILTHLHQDHYIGLAQLLFYIGLLKSSGDTDVLKIIGPKGHLEHVVSSAFSFIQVSRFPELKVNYRLLPINPGQDFEIDGLHFQTSASNHVSGTGVSEEALTYKVIEPEQSASMVFTGDTSFHPPVADFARGAKVLIHDAAHTSPRDAAKIADMAQVGRLMLIHYSLPNAEQSLVDAREVFHNSFLAREGETLIL